ncbi:MAG: HEAT repeat domain-containing protein [Thermodesulfobacteriota bacterium]
MIFYCPNCWAHVRKDEKVCHECETDIEPLDHRDYFGKLVNALNHPERTTRIRAAYIMGTLGYHRAVKPLVKVLENPKGLEDIFFIEAVAISLGKVDGEEAIPILIRLMEHPSFLVRKAALHSLSNFRNEEAIKAVKRALEDTSPNVQELARKILKLNEERI